MEKGNLFWPACWPRCACRPVLSAEAAAAADMSAACEAAGMVFRPLTGDALQDEIRGIFADYKDYMTAEGLYFYE